MRVKPDPCSRRDSCIMKHRLPLVVFACVVMSGCSSLLPRSSSDTPGGFATFEAAQAAAERIIALETRFSELKGLGFDPEGGANVTLIPYPDIASAAGSLPDLADVGTRSRSQEVH